LKQVIFIKTEGEFQSPVSKKTFFDFPDQTFGELPSKPITSHAGMRQSSVHWTSFG
jgi:hypothetical protein